MPYVTPLTKAGRDADARRKQIQRTRRILRMAIKFSKYETFKNVANELDTPESTFSQWINLGTLRACDLARLVQILDLDQDTINALVGNKKRCMYDEQ